jgi:hypothetical protein
MEVWWNGRFGAVCLSKIVFGQFFYSKELLLQMGESHKLILPFFFKEILFNSQCDSNEYFQINKCD